MRLNLTTRGIELTPDLRDRVSRRILFGLGRFSARIKSVSVRLADVNGPRGGFDKSCVVHIDAGLRRDVVIREQHTDVDAAVALAVERAGQSVSRQLRLHGRRQAAAAAGLRVA